MITLKDIHFGVEVETVGATRETVARAVQSVVGGTVTHVGTPGCYDPWECRDAAGRTWRVVADSSLTSAPPGATRGTCQPGAHLRRHPPVPGGDPRRAQSGRQDR